MKRRKSGKPPTGQDDAPSIAVFGGGDEGRTIAEQLAEGGASVSFFDERPAVLRRADDDVATGQVVLDDADSLACTDAAAASVVVIAGHTDRRNLLLAQLLRTGVGVDRVVFRVNDPANADAFTTAGFEAVAPDDDVPGEMCAAVDRTLRQGTSA